MKKYLFILFALFIVFPLVAHAENMIIGPILWNGPKPAKLPPKIVEHQGVCGSKRSSNIVFLSGTKLLGTVEWLTPEGKNTLGKVKDADRMTYIISQKNCEFSPQILVVPAGAYVEVVNDDKRDNWLIIEAQGMDKQQALHGVAQKPIKFQVLEPDVIKISSGFYEWMRGWIIAVDRRFWTDSAKDGFFEFRNVPKGKYILHVWHPILGEKTLPVKVGNDQVINLSVAYDMPKEKPVPIIDATILTRSEEARDQAYSEDPFKK